MAGNLSRRGFVASAGAAFAATIMAGCSAGQGQAGDATVEQDGIDYMALVNKQHELPDGWEDKVEIVNFSNTEEWSVDVEAKAYDAYLQMKEELEADGVFVDLDSAYRSVEEQQRIWDDFTEKYGEEYTRLHVAVPGFSEHHTGLALDLFLIIDGKGVYYNEDMVQYPEIWEKIHARLADHGFILRYLPGKKIETGYSYEPWHIRYLDDPEVAREIMDAGITFERYLGELDPMIADCEVDYGTSELYEETDMDSALDAILAEFTGWTGCVMKRLAFSGDDACGDEELAYVNELREANTPDVEAFDQAIVFTSNFRSPIEKDAENTAWEPDTDYEDWTWHLGRTGVDGSWQLMTWGFC
ncbi:MAG: M15 family metallopeptidase [Atopobiaceae bacterium]|nr:M15 family metallopeptidase [Atopobiaceae bacterium]